MHLLPNSCPLIVCFVSLGAVMAAKIRYGPYGKQIASEEEEGQDFSKIPGEPGVDYPLYHSVPETRFSCKGVPFLPGMYANVETGCQAYHVCHDGREGEQGAAFLCSNGTLFNQEKFTCDWWYNVNCQQAPEQYRLNGDPETNPFTPKKPTSEESDPYKSAGPAKFYHPQSEGHVTPSSYYQPILPATPKYDQSASPKYYQPESSKYYQSASPNYYQPASPSHY